MSDTYAEDARLDREAEEEYRAWCDSLNVHVRMGYCMLGDRLEYVTVLVDKEEEEDV